MEPEKPYDVISKKAAKKKAAKAEKARRREEAASKAASSIASLHILGPDPLAGNYGDIPIKDQQSTMVSGRVWTDVSSLTAELEDHKVLFQGWIQSVRDKKTAFLTVRDNGYTVQCVLTEATDLVSAQMVKYATAITIESFVEIEGVVMLPLHAIKNASQQVEVHVRKIHCITRAPSVLPFSVEDASRCDAEIKALQDGIRYPTRVHQDMRLKFRVLDLQTPGNNGIIRIVSQILNLFRQFLLNENFEEIRTLAINEGTSEGVFQMDYSGQPACLAQSPQLHRQMAICSGVPRVFTVTEVFRAEKPYTHRHVCEFTGLDVEMRIMKHYFEVMDVVDRLFVHMFDTLNRNEKCKRLLEVIGKQYPFKPLKYLRSTLRLTFEEGIQMLKDAGVEVDPLAELNTETERTLGKLVLEKYGTEFYMLYRYPLAVRPFYTMPCPDNELYSNSFDVFMRGEQIISGGQRVHVLKLLESRAIECGIDVKSMSSYMDSFKCAPLHGGFGAGLERIVMLFCGLDNVHKVSLFPHDPRRLAP